MSFEIFRNPFAKSKDSSVKFESLQDQLNASSNRKGLQYPIDLGTKDNQDFLLFTIYDRKSSSYVTADKDNTRQTNAQFDADAIGRDAINRFDNASQQMAFQQAQATMTKALGGTMRTFSTPSQQAAVSNFYNNQLDDPLQQARLKQDTLKTQARMSKVRFASENVNRTAYSIALYMPATGIVSNLGTSYKGESMGMPQIAKASGKAGMDVVKEIFGARSEDAEAGKGVLTDMLRQVAQKVTAGSADAAAGVVGLNLNSAAAIEAGRRKVINPYMEFMFESVNQRSYNYSFMFTPRNIEESKAIHDIIRLFRVASLPQIDPSDVVLNYPAEFDIQYYRGGVENTWLPRITRCALSSVELDFTPNAQVQSHAHVEFDDITGFKVSGSPPASINLKLTFQELSTLVRQDVQEGGF